MKTSRDRIITTHAGSLARPPALAKLLQARLASQPCDEAALAAQVSDAVDFVVRHQAEIGIDIVSDGEMPKPGFSNYVVDRLEGVAIMAETLPSYLTGSREARAFPEYYAEQMTTGGKRIVCNGPIRYRGQDKIKSEIETLKAALAKTRALEGFMPAIAPSNLESMIWNEYYKSDEEYLFALADALNEEYRAITDADLVLQIDYPRLLTQYNNAPAQSLPDYIEWLAPRIDAVNYALRDIPLEQIRFHTCYGIDIGPRTTDLELKDVVALMLKIRAGAYSFEASNPRHEHEWKVWRDVKLPDDRILIPGVITNSTVLVEHPELVADRIIRFVEIVGRDRVIAGADCGFATFAHSTAIHPTVVWAKFEALVAGAERATRQLAGRPAVGPAPVREEPMTLKINGQVVEPGVDPNTTLLSVIRDRLGLRGTKEACGRGECGACTVLLNGIPVASCIRLAVLTDGEVTTIEGVAEESRDLREAFAEFGGFQCGFCTAGQIVHATALLHELAGRLTDDLEPLIRKRMSGNICRCTGYTGIIEAVLQTHRRRMAKRRAETAAQ